MYFHFKNIGHRFETWSTGVLGPVLLHGLDHGTKDLSWQKWSYKVGDGMFCFTLHFYFGRLIMHKFVLNTTVLQIGMKGEAMELSSPTKASSVDWLKGSTVAIKPQPLTWYKVIIFT